MVGAARGTEGWPSRPYETAADLRLMQALSATCWRADWPAPSTHPGDLDWWARDAAGGAAGLAERVQLWFAGEADASELVAWGWFSLPGDLDLMIRPDLRRTELVAAIVGWAEERARANAIAGVTPAEAIQAFAGDAQPPVIEALRRLGFHAVEGGATALFTRQFDSWEIPEPILPAGFEVRTLEWDADVTSRVACGRAAFPQSQMTAEKYQVVRRGTLYRPGLDRIVIAPDGSVAAFALGWLDPVNLALELEPVGVHPTYQRRGLGRAVCLAAIRAGQALGATHGLICAEGRNPAALALYAGLGYEITTWARPYRRLLSV